MCYIINHDMFSSCSLRKDVYQREMLGTTRAGKHHHYACV